MKKNVSRREFLKLASSIPLFYFMPTYLEGEAHPREEGVNSPNILIVLFDTLSAYHVSLHGYRRETMPNLARFAERATVYHKHYAAGNFTTPGTASLLTGTYPWTHRAIRFSDTVIAPYETRNIFNLFAERGYHRIAYTHNTLANTLLRQFRGGLETLKPLQELFLDTTDFWVGRLLAEDYDAASVSREFALRRDDGRAGSLFFAYLYSYFQDVWRRKVKGRYGDDFPRGIPNVNGNYFLLEHAIDWIQKKLISLPQPFLSYFHLMPPHEPYFTRREFVDIFDDGWQPAPKPEHPFSEGLTEQAAGIFRRAYDEFIAYVDAQFGRLYNHMQQSGLLDNTWVIFTSDHGELFERGILGHANRTLYEPLIRVPLLIAEPGQQKRRDVYTRTNCVDLLPTLLHVSGEQPPDWVEGEILPPYNPTAQSSERRIFSLEAKGNPKLGPINQGTASMVRGKYKVTYYFGYPQHQRIFEFYDIENDPEERRNLFDEKESLAEAYLEELQDYLWNADGRKN